MPHSKKATSDADAHNDGKSSSKQTSASEKESAETKKVDMVELRRIISTLSKDSQKQVCDLLPDDCGNLIVDISAILIH